MSECVVCGRRLGDWNGEVCPGTGGKIECYRLGYERLESELREAREGKAEAERALSLARELQKCDRHRIEYLEGQVRALNGALGR